ncbi:MAG: hypothetical protein ABL999_10815 [Pyrinomonadaceae bacterium]
MQIMIRLLILVVFTSSGLVLSGGNQKAAIVERLSSKNPSDKVSLKLAPSKDRYIHAEPVPIRLLLSNDSPGNIEWRGTFKLGKDLKITTRNSDGDEVRWDSKKYVRYLVMPSTTNHKPGDSVEQEMLLSGEQYKILFPRPGRYNLQVDFQYELGQRLEQTVVSSNSIQIDITEPKGLDRDAYNFINGPLQAARISSDIGQRAERMQEFLSQYSASVYSQYIEFELAQLRLALGDSESAYRSLCRVASGPDFYYSRGTLDKLAELEAKQLPNNRLPAELQREPCPALRRQTR